MNQFDTQILSPNLLEQGLSKDLDQLKSSFFRQSSYSKLFQKLFDTGPNHGGGLSVPL